MLFGRPTDARVEGDVAEEPTAISTEALSNIARRADARMKRVRGGSVAERQAMTQTKLGVRNRVEIASWAWE